MNKQKKDILRILLKKPYVNQRVLAQLSGYSLGVVNRSMKELLKEGYIDQNNCLTNKSIKEREMLEQYIVQMKEARLVKE